MAISFRRIKFALVGSRPFQIAFLFVMVFFAQPSDFVPPTVGAKPRYTRHRWLKSLPFLPGGLFAGSLASLLVWMGLHRQAIDRVSDGMISQFQLNVEIVRYGAWATLAALIYVLATFRWLFHRTFVKFWIARGKPGFVAPLTYFVVNTAAWFTWLTLYSAFIVWLLKRYGFQLQQGLNGLVRSHLGAFAIASLLLVIAVRLSATNRRKGMLAVYGGSPLRLHLADGLACVIAVAAMALLILLK
jgi:hypothetical protein